MSNKENINGVQRRKIFLTPSDKKASEHTSQTEQADPEDKYSERLQTLHSIDDVNRRRHDRLTQITERCIEYKRRFLKQLQSQLERFDLIFKVNREELAQKFEVVIASLQSKRDELIEALAERQAQLRSNLERASADVETEIGKIVKANSWQQHAQESDPDRDISVYADSIHHFYERMKQLQSYCEAQLSEDIFACVHSQADQALRPADSPDGHFKSISFNNENIFVVESDKRDFLSGVLQAQQSRKARLQNYRLLM